MISLSREQVLAYRVRAQQLDRDAGALDSTVVLDAGVQDNGTDAPGDLGVAQTMPGHEDGALPGGRQGVALLDALPGDHLARLGTAGSCRSKTLTPASLPALGGPLIPPQRRERP